MKLAGNVNLKRLIGAQALALRSQLILKEKEKWINSGKSLRNFKSKYLDPERIAVPVISESGNIKFLPKEVVDNNFRYMGKDGQLKNKPYGIYRTLDDYSDYVSSQKKTSVFGNVQRENLKKEGMINYYMNKHKVSREAAVSRLVEKGYIDGI